LSAECEIGEGACHTEHSDHKTWDDAKDCQIQVLELRRESETEGYQGLPRNRHSECDVLVVFKVGLVGLVIDIRT
jgi:hypothetical protein